MLEPLKFVQGAVAKKDFAPALTHFRIKGGHVKGFNGSLAISSPIDLDLDICPKAVQFVKAINACEDTISLHIDKNKKLVIQSGNFKSMVECVDPVNFPDIKPEGKTITLNDSLLPALRFLEPFIAEDASRPWARAILFDGESAFATNNIVLVQYWLSFKFPFRANIPSAAVRELIRIGEDPVRMQMTEHRIVFHYEDGRWLSTQLDNSTWPDAMALLDRGDQSCPQEPFPLGFWPALDQLLPFCDETNRVYFHGDKMATGSTPDSLGSSVEIECPPAGIYNAKHLSNLREIADSIAFSAYPAAVPFFGKASRGIIVGIRQT